MFFIASVAGIFTFFLCLVWIKTKKTLALPGPKGLPFVGNLLQLDIKSPHAHLTEWARQYGGVYSINLMGDNWVMVSSYKALNGVLVKRGPEFANRPSSIFRINYGCYGSNSNSLIWSNHDSAYYNQVKQLVHQNMKQYSTGLQTIELVVTTMLRNFKEKLDKREGKSFNPKADIYKFTLQSLLYFLIGKFIDEESGIFKQCQEMERVYVTSFSMTGPGSELDAFPWLRFFNNRAYKLLTRGRDILTSVWDTMKPDILESLDPNDVRCLLESMMVTAKDQKEEVIKDINFKTVIGDIVVAGTTTTFNTLSAFVNLMAHYPQVQDKLQKEVDKVVGSSRDVTIADRQDMPYTRATIHELNRFVSVVPLGLPHSTVRECQLEGATLPKGTNILPNVWSLHHDEKFWGDPWQFRPERFLDDQGMLLPADHDNRKHLIPFGAGSRVCVGEVFAMTRMFLYIASVLQHFTIKAAPGDEVTCDPRDYILGIAHSPPDFQVSFIPRN